MIDIARGGSIQGQIDAINRLLELIVPGEKEEGGTMVVPGHGRICDESEVMEYRDMLTIVRPHQGDGRQGHDAAAGQGREADLRVRP